MSREVKSWNLNGRTPMPMIAYAYEHYPTPQTSTENESLDLSVTHPHLVTPVFGMASRIRLA